jgi:Mitochondrial carrier protein
MDSSNVFKGLAFGGIASCVAEIATMPLDVIKVRVQVSPASLKRAPWAETVHVVKTNGPSGLYRGLQPALLRQCSYGSMRYAFYTPLKSWLARVQGKHEIDSLFERALCGAGSGALASVIANPTDLIKIRLQTSGGSDASVLSEVRAVYAEAGVAGFWRGVAPTAARATVLAAAELSSYDAVKRLLIERQWMRDGLALHVSTAMVSGLLATAASSPFDVAKSRLMSDAGGRYTSLANCLVQSVREDGARCLWNGFWPNYARVGPRIIIVFVVMEQLRMAFDS